MDDKRELIGGKLVLFRRNGLWQARVPLHDGRYLWRSLKTADEATATQVATRLYYQTETKLAEGLPVQVRTVDKVIDEYVAMREQDNRLGKAAKRGSSIKHTGDQMLRQIKRVVKFWREYAGKKPIEALDDKLLSGYIPWRKTYYHDMAELPKNAKLDPTDKTLQWEIMMGKMLVRFAHEQGYRGNKPLPTFTFVPKLKRVRPALTITEFNSLHRKLEAYVLASKNDRQRAIRLLLHDYVVVLALSGLRVGEANNLLWRDVEPISDSDGRPNVQLHVRGKTGQRIAVPHIDVKRLLDDRREREGEVSGDAYVFRMPSGTKIINLNDQFDAFLKHIGLTHSSAGEKFTLYSLRHFYAVRGIQRDIDIYTVARNMGTSVQMIEQYYGKHATPPTRARKLGGEAGIYNSRNDDVELTDEQKQARAERQRERRAIRKVLQGERSTRHDRGGGTKNQKS
jgi:integrase